MKTPMDIYNTAMKKKKKNRKGFSLVELIVVLVIMAILAAALVPTLIGYIRQTRESNAKNEASMVVQAAQTIASGAFASPNGDYIVSGAGASGGDVTVSLDTVKGTYASTNDYAKAVEYLSEVKGTITDIRVDATTLQVTGVKYQTENDVYVTYQSDGTYDCGSAAIDYDAA